MICNYINNQKEPSLVYRSDRGLEYSTLQDVLKESDIFYEVGFKDISGEFRSRAKLSSQGEINDWIKNDYIRPIGNNKYKAVDSFAADLLEEYYILNNLDGYSRTGDVFEFGDFSIKPEEFNNSEGKAIFEVGRNIRKGQELFKNKSEKPSYTESELGILIKNALNKIGFSVENVKYISSQLGAKGMVDFTQKLIQIVDGDSSISTLSEEFSHVMVEAMDKVTVDNILKVIHTTPEYAQFSEQYRNIYREQIKNPEVLEKAVRKEVLGKMLSKSLQDNFSMEQQHPTSKNIFNKLLEMLKDLVNFFRSKITNDIRQTVDNLASDIVKGLRNGDLDRRLHPMTDITANVMYDASKIDPDRLRDMINSLKGDVNANTYEEREIYDSIASILVTAEGVLINLENNSNNSGTVFNVDLMNTIERLRAVQSYVNSLNNRVNNSQMSQSFKDSIHKATMKYSQVMSQIDGLWESNNSNSESLLKELEEAIGVDTTDFDQRVNNTEYGLNVVQKDTNGLFWKHFGHIAKSSNLFVAIGGRITGKMHDEFLRNMSNGIDMFIKPLEVLKDELKYVIKNGRLRTGVDEKKMTEDRDNYKLDIINQLFNTSYTTLKDYAEDVKEGKIESVDSVDTYRYKYLLLDKQNAHKKEWLKPEDRDKDIKWLQDIQELFPDLDITQLSEEVLVRDLLDQSVNRPLSPKLRREKQSPYNSDGTLKKGFKVLSYEEVVNTQDRSTIVSDNPNIDVNNLNEREHEDVIFYKIDLDNTSQEADIAFDYMRWNRKLKESQGDKSKTMIDNLRASFEDMKELARINGLSEEETNEVALKWFSENITLDNTPEYFEKSREESGINYEVLYQTLNKGEIDKVEAIRKKLNELSAKKRNIMKRFKNRLDYKEIDVNSITAEDKALILQVEAEISQEIKNLKPWFEAADLDMYKPSSSRSVVRLNVSVLSQIYALYKADLKSISLSDLEKFFFDGNSNSKITLAEYNREKVKVKGKISQNIAEYSQKAQDLGLGTDSDSIMKAYLVDKAMSWMKRYDSTDAYSKFLEDLGYGNVDVMSTIEGILNNAGTGNKLTYINKLGKTIVIPNMQITPSFKFAGVYHRDKKLLIHLYQNTQDEAKKLEYIQELSEISRVEPKYLEDMSDIMNNPNKKKAFFGAWDIQIERLKNDFVEDKTIPRNYISMLPQVRRTQFERIHDTFRGKFNATSMKDWLMEAYAFREDDMENAYEDSIVPMYGYYMLEEEERTEDHYHAMVWGLRNSYQRASRLKYLPHMMKALKGIESQRFENGKNPKDTNYYHMLKKSIDFNYFGKSQSFYMKFTIPLSKWGLGEDIELDFGKILQKFRILSVKAALMFSPLTAFTNFLGGISQNIMMSIVGHDIYGGANLRALGILGGNMHTSIGDIGAFDVKGRLNKIAYQFGYHDIEERYRDARYPRIFRILNDAGFGLMSMTNYPLEIQVMLSKIMEYRLIEGEFIDWKTYKRRQRVLGKTDSEIKSSFEMYSKQSFYDYLDDMGKPDLAKMQADGFKGNLDNIHDNIRAAVRDITERTTMEIRSINEAEGLKNPVLAFLTSMKKWMILVSSNMLSRDRFNYDSMSEEKGMLFTLKDLPKLIVDVAKKQKSLSESYKELSEADRVNIRKLWVNGAMLTAAFALAYMLKGAADDDEEKDNYVLQLSALMAIRNLNELSSASIGIGQSYFETIQAPVMAIQTLANVPKILNFSNIGEEVTKGKYKGMDKWVSDVYKATWIKNLYNVGLAPGGDYSGAEILYQTRNSYLHFNSDGLYSILSLLPEKSKEE